MPCFIGKSEVGTSRPISDGMAATALHALVTGLSLDLIQQCSVIKNSDTIASRGDSVDGVLVALVI